MPLIRPQEAVAPNHNADEADTAQPSFADSSHRRRRKRTADEAPRRLDGHEHSDKTRDSGAVRSGDREDRGFNKSPPRSVRRPERSHAPENWSSRDAGGNRRRFQARNAWRTLRLSSRTCSARTEIRAITNVAESNAQRSSVATDDEETAPTSGATRAKTFTHRRRKPLAAPELLRLGGQQHGQECQIERSEEVHRRSC